MEILLTQMHKVVFLISLSWLCSNVSSQLLNPVFRPNDLPDHMSPGRDTAQLELLHHFMAQNGGQLGSQSLGSQQPGSQQPGSQSQGGQMMSSMWDSTNFFMSNPDHGGLADFQDVISDAVEATQELFGVQMAMERRGVVESDLSREYMQEYVEEFFDKIGCDDLDLGAADCSTCLTGDQLFRMLAGHGQTYLNAAQFGQANLVMLYHAQDLESICGQHIEVNMDTVTDVLMASMLMEGGLRDGMSKDNIDEMLSALMDHDLLDDADIKESMVIDSDSKPDKDSKDDDEEDDDKSSEALPSLFAEGCVNSDKLFDELGLEDSDVMSSILLGDVATLIVQHILDGDDIDMECRQLPRKEFFIKELYDDQDTITQEDFHEMLDKLDLGDTVDHVVDLVSEMEIASRRRRSADTESHVNSDVMEAVRHRRAVKDKERKITKNSNSEEARCYSADELLVIFRADRQVGVSQARFMQICPSLIQQQISGVCRYRVPHLTTDAEKYGYGTLAILFLCGCSMIGAILIPFINKSLWRHMVAVFLGLAVGTLASDAILHQLPQAFGIHPHHGGHAVSHETAVQPMWFGLFAFLALYSFYILQCLVSFKRGELKSETSSSVMADGVANGKDAKIGDIEHQGKPLTMASIKEKITHGGVKGLPTTVIAILITHTLHSLISGLTIGAGFKHTGDLGAATALVILFHEIPLELCWFVIMLHSGIHYIQALFLNVVSSLTAILGLYIGLGVDVDPYVRQWMFAANAGMFLYISIGDVLPGLMRNTAKENFKRHFLLHNVGVLVGVILMVVIAGTESYVYFV